MPVARRRYDITPTEITELAQTAMDALIEELRARAGEIAPSQSEQLEELTAALAHAVHRMAEASYQAQTERISAALEQISQQVIGAVAQQTQQMTDAVVAMSPESDRDDSAFVAKVAEAVIERFEGGQLEKSVGEVRELMGTVVEEAKSTEMSRRAGLDRLDEVLIDLRSSLGENITRQHSVLLDVFHERLTDLRLTEMAEELPARIGEVISAAIERSHELQLGEIASLKDELRAVVGASVEHQEALLGELRLALDAGLERQRSAVIELSDVADRLTHMEAEVSATVERVIGSAFERAQAAQMQRITTVLKELREQQQEAITEALSDLHTTLDKARSTEERVLELVDVVPERVASALGESLSDAGSRAIRIEKLLNELAWALGEMKAGSGDLREELQRAVGEIPDATAAITDAAQRSEARIVDMIGRIATAPSPGGGEKPRRTRRP